MTIIQKAFALIAVNSYLHLEFLREYYLNYGGLWRKCVSIRFQWPKLFGNNIFKYHVE